jgi:predicted transcriptional regulator
MTIVSGPLPAGHVTASIALGITALLALAAALSRSTSLRSLLAAPFVRLYSRFTKPDLLEDATRGRIHAALQERPGAALPDLMRATGLGRGALIHHLQMMERHGLVVCRHDGARRRFHPAGARVPVEGPPPTEAQQRVLALLQERGPLAQHRVAEGLSITPQGASYHLRRLEQAGRAELRVVDGERRWAARAGPPPPEAPSAANLP